MIHLDCVKTHVTVGKIKEILSLPPWVEWQGRAGRPLLKSRLGTPFPGAGVWGIIDL